MVDLAQELSSENATHGLICYHTIGRSRKKYHMRCHIVKVMPDGRLKLRVYGNRYWANTGHIVNVRYVQAGRVVEIEPSK